MRSRRFLCFLALAAIGVSAFAAKSDLPRADKWVKVTTENFTLYSNATASRTRKTAVQLERFRQGLQRISTGFDLGADVPTTMILFKNDVTYEPYKRRRDGSVRNVAGYFLSGPFGNYMTLDISASSRPMRVVYHEYFHSVINNSVGDLPLWLNEGLAEFFSTFKYRELSASVEVGHPIEEHLRHIAQNSLLPWERFYSTTPRSAHYNEGTRQGSFYAQAWLLTHYLTSNTDRMQRLSKYMSGLRAGQNEDDAFVNAFGMNKTSLGEQAATYLKSGASYLIFDFGEQLSEVEAQVEEVSPAEIYYRLGDLLARSGPREDAERHLGAAEEAGWPASAVRTSLGMAAFMDDDHETAMKEWRAALQPDGSSAAPMYYLALMILDDERGQFDPSKTSEATLEARELLELGLKKQPEHFETLVAYARTFLAGTDEPGPAVGAIRLARNHRPLDIDALVVEAALTARAGAVARAFDIIYGDIEKRDPDKAEEAENLATNGILLAAYRQADDGDTEAAAAVLGEALEHVRDATLRDHVQDFYDVFSSGSKIVLSQDSEEEIDQANTAIRDFNAAIALVNSGDYDKAIQQFEEIASACAQPQACELARQKVAELRELVAYNTTVLSIKEALSLYQSGDIKKSIALLREMEESLEDPELRDMVLQTMKGLGVRPAKKN